MTPLPRYLLRYGMTGLPSDASPRALRWERRLNWPLFAVLFLVMASIAAVFVGKKEKEPRREMHRDVRALRGEVDELRRETNTLCDAPRGK